MCNLLCISICISLTSWQFNPFRKLQNWLWLFFLKKHFFARLYRSNRFSGQIFMSLKRSRKCSFSQVSFCTFNSIWQSNIFSSRARSEKSLMKFEVKCKWHRRNVSRNLFSKPSYRFVHARYISARHLIVALGKQLVVVAVNIYSN